MRVSLAALYLGAGISLVCWQSAGAVPAAGAASHGVETTISPLQQVQYRERHSRHGIVKCYRDFIFGRYRCHYYHRAWW